VDRADPEPKALACYGLWLPARERTLLRFVNGRPISPLTCAFLAWAAEQLAAEGVRVLALIWDNASWHISREVQDWVRRHNREVKRTGHGCRLLICRLPSRSPWLNPIEGVVKLVADARIYRHHCPFRAADQAARVTPATSRQVRKARSRAA